MSYKNLVSQIALSAAMVFAGVAHADEDDRLPRLMAKGTNAFVVDACLQELSLPKVDAYRLDFTAAEQAVDCIDRKNVAAFLMNPTQKHEAVADLFVAGSGVHSLMTSDQSSEFHLRVAEKCGRSDGVVHLSMFKECANSVYSSEQLEQNGGLLSGAFMAMVGCAVIRRRWIDKRDAGNNNDQNPRGNEPS